MVCIQFVFVYYKLFLIKMYCVAGFGVDQLRDECMDTYWQSDGQLPRLLLGAGKLDQALFRGLNKRRGASGKHDGKDNHRHLLHDFLPR